MYFSDNFSSSGTSIKFGMPNAGRLRQPSVSPHSPTPVGTVGKRISAKVEVLGIDKATKKPIKRQPGSGKYIDLGEVSGSDGELDRKWGIDNSLGDRERRKLERLGLLKETTAANATPPTSALETPRQRKRTAPAKPKTPAQTSREAGTDTLNKSTSSQLPAPLARQLSMKEKLSLLAKGEDLPESASEAGHSEAEQLRKKPPARRKKQPSGRNANGDQLVDSSRPFSRTLENMSQHSAGRTMARPDHQPKPPTSSSRTQPGTADKPEKLVVTLKVNPKSLREKLASLDKNSAASSTLPDTATAPRKASGESAALTSDHAGQASSSTRETGKRKAPTSKQLPKKRQKVQQPTVATSAPSTTLPASTTSPAPSPQVALPIQSSSKTPIPTVDASHTPSAAQPVTPFVAASSAPGTLAMTHNVPGSSGGTSNLTSLLSNTSMSGHDRSSLPASTALPAESHVTATGSSQSPAFLPSMRTAVPSDDREIRDLGRKMIRSATGRDAMWRSLQVSPAPNDHYSRTLRAAHQEEGEKLNQMYNKFHEIVYRPVNRNVVRDMSNKTFSLVEELANRPASPNPGDRAYPINKTAMTYLRDYHQHQVVQDRATRLQRESTPEF